MNPTTNLEVYENGNGDLEAEKVAQIISRELS